MRKVTVLVLLAAAVEAAWFFGALDLLRGKPGTGVVGQISQEVSQLKQLLEKAREALEPPVTPPAAGDPSRNPFALPPGVQLLAQLAETQTAPGSASDKDAAPAPPPEPPARELGGILVGPRERLAIIDGTIVRAGDSLEGERVVDIRHDRVVLAREGGRRTLRLPPPFPVQ